MAKSAVLGNVNLKQEEKVVMVEALGFIKSQEHQFSFQGSVEVIGKGQNKVRSKPVLSIEYGFRITRQRSSRCDVPQGCFERVFLLVI